MTIERAHIVPYSVNQDGGALAYVPPVLAIAERLLGTSFSSTVRALIGSVGASDKPFNVITLHIGLHKLWDVKGLIGFKPCYIDVERQRSGNDVFFATFSFHWLFKNQLDCQNAVPLKLRDNNYCIQMTQQSDEFETLRPRIYEHVYTGMQPPYDVRRLEDGQVCRVQFRDRSSAVNMLKMLELRWAASRLLCLSGAAGEDFSQSYDDDDSDFEFGSRSLLDNWPEMRES